MRVVVATDKFAGTLPAVRAAQVIAGGWRRRAPRDDVVLRPVADGGVGTVAVVAQALGLPVRTAAATDPLGRPVAARWLVVADTALVETAEASGLHLLSGAELDPRVTSSRGTGEVIRAALDSGVRRIVVGAGGSATNDGGAGLLTALGARLLDAHGTEIGPGGAALARIARIDTEHLDPRLAAAELVLAADVDNPLCGEEGASAVYGPQKGADPATVAELDAALRHWAGVLERDLPGSSDLANRKGSGAAGGLGAALLAIGAAVRSGLDVVADLTGLGKQLARADLAVTGEGRFDWQSLRGKAPVRVARMAAHHGVPCVLVAGDVQAGRRELAAAGFDAAYAVADIAGSVEEAMSAPEAWLEELAARVAGEWSRG